LNAIIGIQLMDDIFSDQQTSVINPGLAYCSKLKTLLCIQNQLDAIMTVKGCDAGGKEQCRFFFPAIKRGGLGSFPVFYYPIFLLT
jgi:hypothetical protein